MYPRITDLINNLFGTHISVPVQSFGFMMAVAFALAYWILYLELKRKEKSGLLSSFQQKQKKGGPPSWTEILGNAFIFGIIGWKLVFAFSDWENFNCNPQEIILSRQGSAAGFFIFALPLFVFYLRKYFQKKNQTATEIIAEVHPHQVAGNILLLAAIAGIIGAKIFHNLENWNLFWKNPIGSLLSFDGLTFYGGLIVAAVAILLYINRLNKKSEKKFLPLVQLLDATAPALMLAYGVGRIGCHIAGDGDWGILADLEHKPAFMKIFPSWFYAYHYPHNVLGEGVPMADCFSGGKIFPECLRERYCFMLAQPVYPTSMWEAITCIILFFVIWSSRRRNFPAGFIFSFYLLLNGLERFFIEPLRVNPTYEFFGRHNIGWIYFSQATLISALLIIGGISGMVWVYIKKKNGTLMTQTRYD